MVKVQIEGSIFHCDTAEEAVRIHRLVGAGSAQPNSPTSPSPTPTKRQNGRAGSVLKKLAPHIGKELNSDDMAKILDAKNATGLGPKVRQLRKSLHDEGIEMDEYIERVKPDPAGPTTWKIHKAA